MWMEGSADKATRATGPVCIALAAGLIAWLIAYWFWEISVRPVSAPAVVVEMNPEALAPQIRTKHLFGRADGVAVPTTATPASTRLSLVGIVSAASGKKGVAVIVIDGKKAVTATIGEDIVPGLVLLRVARDHVELTQDGRITNLMLSTKK